MVNIYKLANTQARNSNYEQILRVVNDSLQGIAVGLGFIMGGTPEFHLDTRRGMYSYDALRRRLTQNTFLQQGLVDFSGPVIRLSSLTAEDFYVLLDKIRLVYAYGIQENTLIPQEAIQSFMEHCSERLGDSYFRTPGTTITSFINLLAVLEQNPGTNWQQLLGKLALQEDKGGLHDNELIIENEDELPSFKRL